MASRTVRSLWLMLLDAALAAACFVIAARLSLDVAAWVYLLYEGGLAAIGIAVAGIVAASYYENWYARGRPRSRIALIFSAITVVGIAFLAQAVVHYADPGQALPMAVMLPGSLLVLAVLALRRLVYQVASGTSFGPQRTLLIGASPVMREIAAALQARPELGFEVAGYLDQELARGTILDGTRVLGTVESFSEVCRATTPDRVVADLMGHPLPPSAVRKLAAAEVPIETPDALYELLFHRVALASLEDSALIFPAAAQPRNAMAVQSIYNNVAALAGILLCGPLMAAIAALIRLSSGKPVFEQRSVAGWNLVPFTLFRFRTTEVRRAGGREQVVPTKLGSLVRRLRLDGLPLLFNLLRGEIALVGPPPVRAEFAQELLNAYPFYRLRFQVKPGIFGWSQCHLEEEEIDVPTGLAYDLYYIRHISVALDCSILLSALRPRRRRAAPRGEAMVNESRFS